MNEIFRNVADVVEEDIFWGFKQNYVEGKDLWRDEEFRKEVEEYFDNFLIPQAEKNGIVVWDDGTKAKCNAYTARELRNVWIGNFIF